MQKTSLLLLGTALFALALNSGCADELEGDDFTGKTLATLKGTLTGDSTKVNGVISLAILWRPNVFGEGQILVDVSCNEEEEDCDIERSGATTKEKASPEERICNGAPQASTTSTFEEKYRVWISQAVGYESQFPISFEIPINTLPIDEAQWDLSVFDSDARVSMGTLVAFNDANENGVYDRGSPGTLGEKLYAVSKDLIVFLDGEYPESAPEILEPLPNEEPTDEKTELSQGFNILIQGDVENRGAHPADTPIMLDIQDPETQPRWYTCSSAVFTHEEGGLPPKDAVVISKAAEDEEEAETEAAQTTNDETTLICLTRAEENVEYFFFSPLDESPACTFKMQAGESCLDLSQHEKPEDWPCP